VTFAAGRVSGSTGCNRFQGTVSQGETADGLVIGPLKRTRMVCPEPLMFRERTFLELLGNAEVFQFLVGNLVLNGSEGSLTFSPRSD
jgi:heat shock protein HslJ